MPLSRERFIRYQRTFVETIIGRIKVRNLTPLNPMYVEKKPLQDS